MKVKERLDRVAIQYKLGKEEEIKEAFGLYDDIFIISIGFISFFWENRKVNVYLDEWIVVDNEEHKIEVLDSASFVQKYEIIKE